MNLLKGIPQAWQPWELSENIQARLPNASSHTRYTDIHNNPIDEVSDSPFRGARMGGVFGFAYHNKQGSQPKRAPPSSTKKLAIARMHLWYPNA